MHREDVRFNSGGLVCAGWLHRMHHEGRRLAVVMAHGLAGIKEMRLDASAERFCEAGYRVLVFDYRHLGASQGEPRQLLHIGRQYQGWAAAVEFARTTPSDPAIKAARRNPQATLSTDDTGHFQPYTGGLFESLVADQIAFLNKALA